MKRLSIFCAAGPVGLQRVLAVVVVFHRRRAGARSRRPGPARRCASWDASCRRPHTRRSGGPRPRIRPRPRVGDSISGRFADSNLWPSVASSRSRHARRASEAQAVEGVGAALPVASTRTRVSRYTRAPSSASSSRRAFGPGVSDHRAALADHDPLLGVALDPHDAPGSAGSRRRLGSSASPASSSSSSSISSAVTAIECGSSSRAIAQQLLAQQLGDEERLGLIGDDAVRVVVRALGQAGSELADERVDALAGARRQRDERVEVAELGRRAARGARRSRRGRRCRSC